MTKVSFLPRLKEIACGALVYCDYAMAFRTDSEPKGQSAVKSATRKQLATTTQATCNSNTIDNSNLNASLQKSGQEGGVSQKRPQQNEKPDSEILRERKSANSKSLFTFAFISILSGRYNFPNCTELLSHGKRKAKQSGRKKQTTVFGLKLGRWQLKLCNSFQQSLSGENCLGFPQHYAILTLISDFLSFFPVCEP